jgi:hypothetical protein
VPPQSAPARPSEDYGFEDDDDDDDLYANGTTTRPIDYRSEDEIFDDPMDDDLQDAAVDAPEETFQPPQSMDVTDEPDEEMEELEDQDDELVGGESLAAEPPVAAPIAAARGAPAIRTLNTYTFQYSVGIPDYDQSRPIVDPESGLQVGDCGMGVNMKNNIVQNNPDNVVALDVWLVDKKQEKSFSSQDRVLLSEYVVDQSLEQSFTRERPNDPESDHPKTGNYLPDQRPKSNPRLCCHGSELYQEWPSRRHVSKP